MALPASGPISMNQIREELGFPLQSPFSLYTAETGGYVLLNQCSTYRPNGSTPNSIAEWYSYNHTQQCPTESCSADLNNGSGGTGIYNIPITLGSSTGTVWLAFNSVTIPDKYEVIYDSITVIDTGFRGSSAYNSALNALGYPSVSGGAIGTASFNKTTATTTAIVRITAPLAGTAWYIRLGCPSHSFCFGYNSTSYSSACADFIPSCT
jgi:hypothetical protein